MALPLDAPRAATLSEHNYGIDALRFMAAFLVVLFHFGSFGLSEPQQYAPVDDRAFPALDGWTQYGWVGVQVFFVLSGYVIAKSAAQGNWKTFLTKRALRIFPALWICATIALIVRVSVSGDWTARMMDWARSVILSPKGPYIDGVIWTLVIEMIFYISVAGVLFVFKPQKGANRLLTRMAIVLGGLSAVFITMRFGLMVTNSPLANLFYGFEWTLLMLNHGTLFGTGMLLSPYLEKPFSNRRQAALIVFGIVCLMQIGVVSSSASEAIVACVIFTILVATLLGAVRYNNTIAPLSHFVGFQTLGKMSYPLYLGHFAVGMHLVPVIGSVVATQFTFLGVSFGLVLAYAYAVAVYAEPKLRSVLRNRLFSGSP